MAAYLKQFVANKTSSKSLQTFWLCDERWVFSYTPLDTVVTLWNSVSTVCQTQNRAVWERNVDLGRAEVCNQTKFQGQPFVGLKGWNFSFRGSELWKAVKHSNRIQKNGDPEGGINEIYVTRCGWKLFNVQLKGQVIIQNNKDDML